ncbi:MULTISPECIES: dihydrofolate reductase family protein [unclassified Romboutsia]|uniref:dihydrofolate reductase family protein n=1 Tax=unclassified Romboutsia TaxID=2626894 RepID=UPI0008202A9B|nr:MULTISPECIES: dihydrofolate reductase family protein [unclassified Romboutsia]SCH70712.1 5-amino-6-(5-phosphoribosylamino)uracil reductase [uncultured Clostridium sp.]
MNGKIILNLAMSIDGYIADEEGGYNWIIGNNNSLLDTENKWSHDEFLKDIDIVVMGKRCYEQNMHKEYKNKKVYVATSEDKEDFDNIHFINNEICNVILDLKNKGQNIYLFGGGVLIDEFIKENIIDEYIFGIIPTVLGKGRPLFLGNNTKIDLHLDYYSIEDGIIILKYLKINK